MYQAALKSLSNFIILQVGSLGLQLATTLARGGLIEEAFSWDDLSLLHLVSHPPTSSSELTHVATAEFSVSDRSYKYS